MRRAYHRGCVTPQILGNLSSYGVERIAGFSGLGTEDQTRVGLALQRRRIGQADLTTFPSFSQPDLPSSQPTSTQRPAPSKKKKRKAETMSGPSRDQDVTAPSPMQAASHRAAIGGAAWEEGADAEEIVEEQVDELYCTLSSNVVGVQYYKGLVDAGEQVRLIREPHNRYDRNAIAVQNINRTQVGHIPRQTAVKLAPLIDAGLITVEGTMNQGNLRSFDYSLSVTLMMYGAADKRNQIEPLLRWAIPAHHRPSLPSTRPYDAATSHASYTVHGFTGYDLSMSSGYDSRISSSYGIQNSSASQTAEALQKQQEESRRARELRQMLTNFERVDDEGRRSSLLDTLCSAEDVLNLPEHPNPPGIASGELRVDLLRHQKQALQWAIEHENPKLPTKEEDQLVQFWQYRNTGSKTPQEAPPALGRGALCGDSMGLGKTLTMIALILATKNDISSEFSNSTLIVVPLSVLSNWEKQIQDHCVPEALSYVMYYGAGRDMSAKDLQKCDVVVTTYQTVVGEHNGSTDEVVSKKRKKSVSGLFGVQWKRIVLDEGHNIRNPRTKMAKSVYALNAQRRWVLTGTPIINSPQDLGSVLTFLRVCCPLDNPDFQTRLLLRPLKSGNPSGAELLRMQDSDGNHLVPLPEIEMTVVPVTLNPEARELYDNVEQLSKELIEGFLLKQASALSSLSFSTNALSMLTRLRQLALHPGLIPSDYLDQLRLKDKDNDDSAMQITPEQKAFLQSLLLQAIEDNEECPICFGVLDDPRITACSHRFCLACIEEVVTRDARCPMDRRPLRLGDFIEPPTELTQAPIHMGDDIDEVTALRAGSSAKIDQLLHLLQLTPEKEKSLVFSQFTSFLDKIAEVLDKEGIPYVRFDGKMSAKRRQETLETFCVPVEQDTREFADARSNSHTSVSEALPMRRRALPQRLRAVIAGERRPDAAALSVNSDDDDEFVPHVDVDNDDDTGTRSTKGKGKARGTCKAATGSRHGDTTVYGTQITNVVNPRVMLISLKAGALGLNLTVANNIYLWWQEGIESQAIDRCNRIGQRRNVHVYQLIAENTVESKAFSGMRGSETPRQKKEARLQDLVELFGIRRQTAC
ncbi:SNF2 family N-terminal domain-containing protein [Multifurca ochricompacta]|uniref:SNF2 family N-terminal domain-containing protein n=1 Tax=Multifurca ochricompacta TaxID=376703 RepID=A0AAD4M8P3_9AGAM|nr:SNF2 family N-terminal domain-containing protein [Multifurca ochricompacta]